jgi:hypothetical protein
MSGAIESESHQTYQNNIMANYYTNFSVIVPLKQDAHKQYAVQLAQTARDHKFSDDPVPNGFPVSLVDCLEDWNFETESDNEGIWVHSDTGGIDAACAFIQHLLQEFDRSGSVSFEWSHDCSKPRLDAFGGGAAFITVDDIKTMNTSDWLLKERTVWNQQKSSHRRSKPLKTI